MPLNHYEGGCQCGAVSYEADVDLDNTLTCNCSRCQRMGFVLAFTPRENFQLKSGDGQMTEYLFNRKTIRHLFCSTCGVESFAYGKMPDGTRPSLSTSIAWTVLSPESWKAGTSMAGATSQNITPVSIGVPLAADRYRIGRFARIIGRKHDDSIRFMPMRTSAL